MLFKRVIREEKSFLSFLLSFLLLLGKIKISAILGTMLEKRDCRNLSRDRFIYIFIVASIIERDFRKKRENPSLSELFLTILNNLAA